MPDKLDYSKMTCPPEFEPLEWLNVCKMAEFALSTGVSLERMCKLMIDVGHSAHTLGAVVTVRLALEDIPWRKATLARLGEGG